MKASNRAASPADWMCALCVVQSQRLSRQAKLCFAESMHAQTAMVENGVIYLPQESAVASRSTS